MKLLETKHDGMKIWMNAAAEAVSGDKKRTEREQI